MTPEQIKKFGVANNMPSNVIYKLLEKYHYITFYKKCKEILDDGVTDAEINSLKEARVNHLHLVLVDLIHLQSKHEKLINKVASINTDDYRIYLSRSQDLIRIHYRLEKNCDYEKNVLPRHARKIEINTTNMILDICTMLYKKGICDIVMVVGSDRVREFDTIIKKYNDVKSRHGYYNFDKINIVSGERDPDADNVSGMSASKMRASHK